MDREKRGLCEYAQTIFTEDLAWVVGKLVVHPYLLLADHGWVGISPCSVFAARASNVLGLFSPKVEWSRCL